MNIYINVSEQKLQVSGYPRTFVAGTVDFIKFIFTLNDQWEDLLVTAQFEQNGKTYYQYLDENNSVYLPAGLTDGLCELSLYGTNGIITATSEKVAFKLLENTFHITSSGLNQSSDMYSQLVDKLLGIQSEFDIWVDNVSDDFSVLQSRINALILSMNANKIQMGRVSIESKADDTVTEYPVVFDTPFESAPIIVCSPITSDPQETFSSIQNVSNTGFTIQLYRKSVDTEGYSTTVDVFWIAASPEYFSNTKEETELTDSRIGYNGTIYDTLGDAIREQIQALFLNTTTFAEGFYGNLSGMENAAHGKLTGFTVYGKTINAGDGALVSLASNGSVEIGTGNRNLIKLTPGYTWTSNGVTLTVNDDMSIHLAGTSSGKSYLHLPLVTTIPGGTPLYYYAKVVNGTGTGSVRVNLNGTSTSKPVAFEKTMSYLESEWTTDCNRFEITIEAGETVDVTVAAMVSVSGTELPYEATSCNMVSIPVSYGLASVPVSSNGNYTDEDGQQYICDTIEYQNGMCRIVRRIGVIESYNGETITTAYLTTASALTTGKPVVYVLPTYFVEEVESDIVDSLNQLLTYRDFTTVLYTSSGALLDVNPKFMYRISLEDLITQNSKEISDIMHQVTSHSQELLDLRHGFDAITYASAGEAVRTQLARLDALQHIHTALNEIRWDSQNIYSKGTVLLESGILRGYSTSDFTPVTLSGYNDYQVWSTPLEGLTQVEIPFENEYPNTETRVFILSSDSSAMAFTQNNLLESTSNWISVNSDKKTVTLSNLDWWMKAEHGGYHTLYVTISRNRPSIYVPDAVANHITEMPERLMVPDERIVAYNQLRMIEDGTITLFADNALYGARASKYAAVCFDVQGCTDYMQMDDRLIIRGAGIDATNGATVTVNYCKHNVHKIDLSKTIALYTVSKGTNADVTKKVLVIGDSWTNGATWLHYLVDNFADDSTNLELLGTRPGDTTYTSGIWNGQEKPKHEGRSGWNAYAYCHAQSHNGFENAFWNPNTETFDFSYYMGQQGYDDVDIVIVALGMNATTVAVNGHYPTIDEDSACLKMMVESIKAYNSDVTVGIWLTPPPGQANGDHLILEKDKRLLVNESVIQTFANSGYYNQHVYLIPTNIVMDTTWGYPIGERAVSESVPCASESKEGHTETYHTEIRSTYEALHPNYVGNQQVANIVYAYIKLL